MQFLLLIVDNLFHGTSCLMHFLSCAGCCVPNDTKDNSTNELCQGNRTLRFMHGNSYLCLWLLKIRCLVFFFCLSSNGELATCIHWLLSLVSPVSCFSGNFLLFFYILGYWSKQVKYPCYCSDIVCRKLPYGFDITLFPESVYIVHLNHACKFYVY